MTTIARGFITQHISNLNLQNASHASIEESVPKFLLKSKGRSHSRAMGDADLPDVHPLERFDRFLQLLRGQEIQVRSTQNGVKFLFSHFVDHMVDDIDHP